MGLVPSLPPTHTHAPGHDRLLRAGKDLLPHTHTPGHESLLRAMRSAVMGRVPPTHTPGHDCLLGRCIGLRALEVQRDVRLGGEGEGEREDDGGRGRVRVLAKGMQAATQRGG